MNRKAPAKEGNLNSDFCEALIELSNWEKSVNKNQFKQNAYRKAAQTLAGLDYRIKDGSEAKKLDGVGEKIAQKIDEMIETGKIAKLETILSDESYVAVNLLQRVAGVGPAKAQELVSAGITSLEQLRDNLDQLTSAQRIGLKYLEDFEQRIPRREIEKIVVMVRKCVRSVDRKYVVMVCGSYRRGAHTSGDIDILLTHPDHLTEEPGDHLARVVRSLTEEQVITDTLSQGSTKFMGVCRLSSDLPARRLDIRLIPHHQFYCGVLYFTGSDSFNRAMRSWALDRGFTLNEYCLRPMVGGKPQEPLPVSSEIEIFHYLEFPYKQPKDR